MRKVQQSKILELLTTLQKAHDELKTLVAPNLWTSLLSQCQEFAIQIGQYIENIEGDGTKTVILLEEYCEIAYEASLSNHNNDSIKRLKEHLIKIEQAVRSELTPNKIEVVFFPYMLSMFDCFESIYYAAKADPACDVYVAPIPWFDKYTDGTLGTMHYDGAQYPDYIDVTSWQAYDVETRRPDIIFIHNPYDESNYITSVHTNYYSKRLRSFTDCLVYIPYFVSAGGVAKEFCVAAGCVYAHKVILESEKVRNIYIKTFRENFGNRYGKPENKFVAIGSPKYDAIHNIKQKDLQLPTAWRNLLFHEDGTKKKVVLYNTTVGAALRGGAQYLHKLRTVLSMFREQDDVVLWWRPHPLCETMYQSMLPHLQGEYERLIKRYDTNRTNGKYKVILDQSADLYRAIAVSDAYFGDRASSLVALYEQTGNPMMFQNIQTIEEPMDNLEYEWLHSDIISFGARLISVEQMQKDYPEWYAQWFPNRNESQKMYVSITDIHMGLSSFINAIYDVDIDKGVATYLRSFPDEKNIPYIYRFMIRIGNQIIFCPNRARKWAFFDTRTNTWSYEPIPKDLLPAAESGTAFNSAVLYGESYIYMPGESKAFAKYHIGTGKITYHTSCRDSIEKIGVDFNLSVLSGAIVYGNSLLLFSPLSNYVIELNPDTMDFVRYYCIGTTAFGVKACILIPHTNTIYLIKQREKGQTQWTETILKWDIQTNALQEFNQLPIHLKPTFELNALNSFLFWNNTLYATPLQGDCILKIDIKTDAITPIALSPTFDFFERKSDFYSWAKDLAMPYVLFDAENIRFLTQLPYDYQIAAIDFEKGEISNRKKWRIEGAQRLFRTKGKYPATLFYENQYFDCQAFFNQLVSGGLLKTNPEKPSGDIGNYGEQIYQYIKNYIM